MKKVLYTWVLVIAIFLLGACSREPRLDHRSILDTELGVVFTLGDSRESIEAILGDPIEHEEMVLGMDYLTYENGLTVLFLSNTDISVDGIAFAFEAKNEPGAERFEILGYDIGMTHSQVANNFALDEDVTNRHWSPGGRNTFFYVRFYNRRGRVVEADGARFIGRIEWWQSVSGDFTVLHLQESFPS